MPIDLVIDDREGGSKSDSEEITRSVALDQVHLSICACVCVRVCAHARVLPAGHLAILGHYCAALLFAYD